MAKDNLTSIVVVLDRSGSMGSVKQDMIGGFNEFINDQKKQPGEAVFSLVQFDTEYEVVYNQVPIQNVKELNEDTYAPRGMTALLDAMGKAVTTAQEKIDKLDEKDKPGKVIFVILTDGYENSSKEYKKDQVSSLVDKAKKDRNWEFMFIGASMDQIGDAHQLNIGAANARAASLNTGGGVRLAAKGFSHAVSSYRGGDVNYMSSYDATVGTSDTDEEENKVSHKVDINSEKSSL